MASLVRDPEMYSTQSTYDLALLDTSERQRSEITPEGLYVINRRDEAVLRYVRPGAGIHYVISDASLAAPEQWERLALSARDLAGLIKARVRWIGRERDRGLPASQRGRFLYDPISS